MRIGYRELTEEEKGAFWEFLVSLVDEYPIFATGVAAVKFFKSRFEYKKYYQDFESKCRGLIPDEILPDDTKHIFEIVINYLKHFRSETKKLSHYYLNSSESPKLVDELFNACKSSGRQWIADDESLRKALENLTFVLLQNNNDDVMLLTETADVIRDILIRLEQDGNDIELLKKDVAALQAAIRNLKPNYSSLISNIDLPDRKHCDNIFSFCNHGINFYGREEEISKIQEWLKKDGVSICGIVGPGGSGKSRLALHIAHLEKEKRKVVWADKTLLNELLTCNNFSYSQPVLLIFDYAAQLEKELNELIKLMVSRKNPNVKFLLLERSNTWYTRFRNIDDTLESVSEKEAIDLSASKFSDNDYRQMMTDFSKAKYNEKPITEETQTQIIQKAKELSVKETSARCLFLLLVTDAYLRVNNIHFLNSEELFKNYIKHTFNILKDQYGEEIAKTGYRILAFTTAYNEINISEMKNHSLILDDWNQMKRKFKTKSGINSFFSQITEFTDEDAIPAMKPDLIGEYLFLYEWNDLIDEQSDWLSVLLQKDYSRAFFAMCLADWPDATKNLCDMLTDQNADAEQRALCAEVLNYAIREAHSKKIQMEYLVKIKELDYNTSIFILNAFTDAIRFIFENAEIAIRNRCIDEINKIDFQMYSYKDDSDRVLISAAMENIASLYISYDLIEKALYYYESAKKVLEGLVDSEKYSLQLAELYNNIARSYIYLRDMKPQSVSLSIISLQYYQKALETLNKPAYHTNPLKVTILNGLVSIYIDAKLFDRAIECFEQCLLIIQVGNVPPTIAARTFFKMGAFFYDLMMFEDAIKYYKKALDIQNRELGELHADTMMTYNNIALAYHQMGDKNPIYYKDALEYYLHDMHNKEKVYGENNTETAITYLNMAHLYNSMGDTEKAIHYALLAEPTHVNYYGSDNHWTQEIYDLLAKLYTKAGQIESAQKYMNKLKKNN